MHSSQFRCCFPHELSARRSTMATKFSCAVAGFCAGALCYYTVRDSVWVRAESVAAQLSDIQDHVPSLAKRPVQV